MSALRKYQQQLIAGNVTIYVRRAGPNYQEGLRMTRELGESCVLSRVSLDHPELGESCRG